MPTFRHFTAALAACACSFLPGGLLATTAASAAAPWLERPATLGEPLSSGEVETLRRLYALGEPALRWFDAAGRALPLTTEALALLAGAADEGLRPTDYRAEGVRSDGTPWQCQVVANPLGYARKGEQALFGPQRCVSL